MLEGAEPGIGRAAEGTGGGKPLEDCLPGLNVLVGGVGSVQATAEETRWWRRRLFSQNRSRSCPGHLPVCSRWQPERSPKLEVRPEGPCPDAPKCRVILSSRNEFGSHNHSTVAYPA